MYKSFFGLNRNPFDLTPDPACFVATRRHNEALAVLYYGVRSHKGFVVITGEAGTGKTLLLRCLLQSLQDSRDISYSYLFNSRLSTVDFFQYVLADFGLSVSGKNKGELLRDFREFLTSRMENRLTTVLIVDEAHHLSEDLLEEIRLLSNLETNDTKLLQIVLIGQPELDEKLDSHSLRQLKQRIALRTHLAPLDIEETADYIGRRLQIAGADSQCDPIFPIESILVVHNYSRGLPRLINTICENGLIAAYAQQSMTVTRSMIESVAKEFRLDVASDAEGDEPAMDEADIDKAANLFLEDLARTPKTAAGETSLNVAATESEHK